jgi:hypothetical protein
MLNDSYIFATFYQNFMSALSFIARYEGVNEGDELKNKVVARM